MRSQQKSGIRDKTHAPYLRAHYYSLLTATVDCCTADYLLLLKGFALAIGNHRVATVTVARPALYTAAFALEGCRVEDLKVLSSK